MTQWEMTRHEAGELARFIATLRSRMGNGSTWDRPGIEAALAEARHRAPAPAVACAAIRAAADPANRTPAVIALDGPHWRTTPDAAPAERRVAAWDRCSVCDAPLDDHRIADHEPRRNVRPTQPPVDIHATITGLRDLAATDRPHDQEQPE